MGIKIREIDVNEIGVVVDILNHLPEFNMIFYKKKLLDRLNKYESIILVAEYAGKPVGCKLAYNRYFDGSVYSWLGGVLKPYRKQGIATLLLCEMEKVARSRFFYSIRMKTRNCHADMLRFAIKHNFKINGFEARGALNDARIELIKSLK